MVKSEMTDEQWMQYALKLAGKAAELGEVPVAAIVVLNNKIIGEGWNQPISSHDPTAHAEIIALRDAAKNIGNYRLPETTLYVTIEPCTMCAGAIVHGRVKRVVYGATEPKSGVVESNGCLFNETYLNHVVEYQGGVLAEQCSEVMSVFFQQRRKVKKALKSGAK